MLTGVRRNSKIEVPLDRRRKNCWCLSEKSRTKNREWKTHQGSTFLIPDGGMCPAFGLLWRTGTPRLAEQGSHPWWSLKQVLNIHFCYYCFAKIQTCSRPLGKTPGQSPITARRKSLFHSRWIHWAMWCQQPWPGSQSLLCLQHTPPLFPLPAPFPGCWIFVVYLELGIIHDRPGPGSNPPCDPLTPPNSRKGHKRRDRTPAHPHPTSALAPCNVPPHLKWENSSKGSEGRTLRSVIFWIILTFALLA